ncbi:hypothetical protein Tco_1184502 [Tanacetum coccineum]
MGFQNEAEDCEALANRRKIAQRDFNIPGHHGISPPKLCLESMKFTLEVWPEFWDILNGAIWKNLKTMVNGPDQRDFNLPEKIFNLELKRRT